MRDYYKTIVISDLHIGEKSSKVKSLNNFLKHHKCDHLIINGNLFGKMSNDGPSPWKKKHLKFFSILEKMMVEDNTRISIIRGIGDHVASQAYDLLPKGVLVTNELEIVSGGKKYLIVHGDIFQHMAYRNGWAKTTSGKEAMLMAWLGKYFPGVLTNAQMMDGNGEFIDFITSYVANRGYEGVICGQTHEAIIQKHHGIDYLNSGDWIKSQSALVETSNGKWNLCYSTVSTISASMQKKSNSKMLEAAKKSISAA